MLRCALASRTAPPEARVLQKSPRLLGPLLRKAEAVMVQACLEQLEGLLANYPRLRTARCAPPELAAPAHIEEGPDLLTLRPTPRCRAQPHLPGAAVEQGKALHLPGK